MQIRYCNVSLRCDKRHDNIETINIRTMATEKRNQLKEIMSLAWSFVRKNGYSMSEALKCAWTNIKLRALLHKKVVEFYFKKTDGTLRQAFGTLMSGRIPETKGTKKTADNCQVYFDTEKNEYRCFKKCNLIKIA